MVLDASMALSWLMERAARSERARAEAVLDSLAGSGAVVPALWFTEIENACLVAERRRIVKPAQTTDFPEPPVGVADFRGYLFTPIPARRHIGARANPHAQRLRCHLPGVIDAPRHRAGDFRSRFDARRDRRWGGDALDYCGFLNLSMN